jgi:hypothetical protein
MCLPVFPSRSRVPDSYMSPAAAGGPSRAMEMSCVPIRLHAGMRAPTDLVDVLRSRAGRRTA